MQVVITHRQKIADDQHWQQHAGRGFAAKRGGQHRYDQHHHAAQTARVRQFVPKNADF